MLTRTVHLNHLLESFTNAISSSFIKTLSFACVSSLPAHRRPSLYLAILVTIFAPACACSVKLPSVAGLRRPGTAALDLAYVAVGFTDDFFETGLSIWAVAAGSLIVTEAGGLEGNFTGEADFLEQGKCLAGNPRAYGQLVSILGKYSKFAGGEDKQNH